MVKILGEGVGLIPGQGAKISHAVQYYKKKNPERIKKKKKTEGLLIFSKCSRKESSKNDKKLLWFCTSSKPQMLGKIKAASN